jgi:hypothetical protein
MTPMAHRVSPCPGDVFGRLTVLAVHPASKEMQGRARAAVRCECGTVKTVGLSNLLSGDTRSCGCLYRESRAEGGKANATHGHCRRHGGRTREFVSWTSMWQRVRDPNSVHWQYYGSLGVTVCDRWQSFENFLADMGPRPSGMTLDRIDPCGDYGPANCRWADMHTQNLNRRPMLACRRGHPYLDASRPHRCRICAAANHRARYHQRKAAAA